MLVWTRVEALHIRGKVALGGVGRLNVGSIPCQPMYPLLTSSDAVGVICDAARVCHIYTCSQARFIEPGSKLHGYVTLLPALHTHRGVSEQDCTQRASIYGVRGYRRGCVVCTESTLPLNSNNIKQSMIIDMYMRGQQGRDKGVELSVSGASSAAKGDCW